MKERIKRYLPQLLLILAPVGLFLLQRYGGFLAGSKIDWISQHTVFPDYFRNKFYETGNFFPQYAAELGGGQNIYNFAYYGLYHPLYLFSYLLPFVKMRTYLQGLLLFEWCADGILMYRWLGSHVRRRYAFFGAMQLILSVPVIYHSSGQVMFVSYLPFLLLLFISYERKQSLIRNGCMMLAVFGMILSSFYFSVGCLAAFGIYVISDRWSREKEPMAEWIRHLWGSCYPVIFGIALSAFYLLPVYEAMKGRSGAKKTWDLKELFIPDVTVHKILYSAYGTGLTVIALLAVCTFLFYKSSRERILGSMLLFCYGCPFVLLVLNGGLYIREKALIPMLPLFCFLTAEYLKKTEEQELGKKELFFGAALTAGILCAGIGSIDKAEQWGVLADGIICAAVLLLLRIRQKYLSLMLTFTVMFLAALVSVRLMKSKLVTKEEIEDLDNPQITEQMEKYQAEAGDNYRIEVRGTGQFERDSQNRIWCDGQKVTTGYSSFYNADYQKFRTDLGMPKATRNILMQDMVDNPLFLRFMGVKYLIGRAGVPGYEKAETKQSVSVCRNDHAAPISYLTNQTITEEQFQKLDWAQKQLLLQQCAVAGKARGNAALDMQDISAAFVVQQDGAKTEDGKSVTISSSGELKGQVVLEKPAEKDMYLFLSFEVKNYNKNKDVSVFVQGIKNKLSAENSTYYNQNRVFHYTCALKKGMQNVKVRFGKGKYRVSNIHAEIGTIDEERSHNLWKQKVDLTLTDRGDGFSCTCESDEDTWLITSLPYDENFKIYIDGNEIQKQKVNQAFLGARIKAGTHVVLLKYEAKGSRAGRWITGSMCVLFVLLWMFRLYKIRRCDCECDCSDSCLSARTNTRAVG